jgi:hypothetical protein
MMLARSSSRQEARREAAQGSPQADFMLSDQMLADVL